MKLRNSVLMVIKGESIPAPELRPQAPSEAGGTAAPAASGLHPVIWHSDGSVWSRPTSGTVEGVVAVLRVTAASAAAPADPNSTPPSGGLESWMPQLRSFDSLSLLGEKGVLVVGVNDLGWVVYDWAPGP